MRILFASALEGSAFVTFYPAIVASTLICGWRQGAVVLILSALSAWYLFLEPLGSIAFKDVTTAGALTGFLLAGGFTLIMVAILRETIRRLEIANAMQETLFRVLRKRPTAPV